MTSSALADSAPTFVQPHADYEAIEAAVMETARGRWFLDEYARRHRMADTRVLLEAIERLEIALAERNPAFNLNRIRRTIIETAEAVADAKAELGLGTGASGRTDLTGLLDELAAAATAMRGAGEEIEDIFRAVRRSSAPHDAEALKQAEALQQQASAICAASSRQAAAADKLKPAAAIFALIDQRLASLADICRGDQPLAGAEGRSGPGAGRTAQSEDPPPDDVAGASSDPALDSTPDQDAAAVTVAAPPVLRDETRDTILRTASMARGEAPSWPPVLATPPRTALWHPAESPKAADNARSDPQPQWAEASSSSAQSGAHQPAGTGSEPPNNVRADAAAELAPSVKDVLAAPQPSTPVKRDRAPTFLEEAADPTRSMSRGARVALFS